MLSLYVILFLITNFKIKVMQNTDFSEVQGLWQFEKMAANSSGKKTSSGITDQYTFQIKNSFITISLFTDHLTNWKSKDDIYILKIKWIEHTLYYLPPFGDWTPLADFDGTNFYQSDGKQKRIFKKIAESEIVDWNSEILKKDRLPFDYDLHKNKN